MTPLEIKLATFRLITWFLEQQRTNEECDGRSVNQNHLMKQISINITGRLEGLYVRNAFTACFKYSFLLSIIACLVLKHYGSPENVGMLSV
jgi:hypothetical protein